MSASPNPNDDPNNVAIYHHDPYSSISARVAVRSPTATNAATPPAATATQFVAVPVASHVRSGADSGSTGGFRRGRRELPSRTRDTRDDVAHQGPAAAAAAAPAASPPRPPSRRPHLARKRGRDATYDAGPPEVPPTWRMSIVRPVVAVEADRAVTITDVQTRGWCVRYRFAIGGYPRHMTPEDAAVTTARLCEELGLLPVDVSLAMAVRAMGTAGDVLATNREVLILSPRGVSVAAWPQLDPFPTVETPEVAANQRELGPRMRVLPSPDGVEFVSERLEQLAALSPLAMNYREENRLRRNNNAVPAAPLPEVDEVARVPPFEVRMCWESAASSFQYQGLSRRANRFDLTCGMIPPAAAAPRPVGYMGLTWLPLEHQTLDTGVQFVVCYVG